MLIIKLSNKIFYSSLFLILLLIIALGGYAYNSGLQPSVFGHTANEINGLPTTKLVVHSQRTESATCPAGWNQLWAGKSFLGSFNGAGYAGSFQDLGDTGSCLSDQILMPGYECTSTGCDYVTPGDYGFWLTISGNKPSGNINSLSSFPLISNCAVCEKTSSIIVLHSQRQTIPACPASHPTRLWEGYSFLGATFGNGFSDGQDLSSTGSCLNAFIALPVLECSYNSCAYTGVPGITTDNFGWWMIESMTAVDGSGGFRDAPAQNPSALANAVSRCSVCST